MSHIATLQPKRIGDVAGEVRRMVRMALSHERVFESVMDQMGLYYGNLPTKTRGDVFEVLCREYLLATERFRNVWLLKDVPADVRLTLGLGTKDMGMDLVCECFPPPACKPHTEKTTKIVANDDVEDDAGMSDVETETTHEQSVVAAPKPPTTTPTCGISTSSLFCAVQAKYRKRSDKSRHTISVAGRGHTTSGAMHSLGAARSITIRPNVLRWGGDLATFYALCARTGPWKNLIVMTTCDSISWQGKKTPSDKTYAYKTWCGIERSIWLRIAGSSGYSLLPTPSPLTPPAILQALPLENLVDTADTQVSDVVAVIAPPIPNTSLSMADLREKRAAFYAKR